MVKRVIPEGKTMCSLCSRLRRGVLYRVARRDRRDQDRARPPPRRHPRDVLPQPVLRRQAEGDAAQAALRRRQARRDPAARLLRRDGPRGYAELRQFPIIPCDLCGSQDSLQRKQMKELLREWEKRYPGARRNHVQQPAARPALAPAGPRSCSISTGRRRSRGEPAGRLTRPLILKMNQQDSDPELGANCLILNSFIVLRITCQTNFVMLNSVRECHELRGTTRRRSSAAKPKSPAACASTARWSTTGSSPVTCRRAGRWKWSALTDGQISRSRSA